jgi:hypothetical protein
MVDHLFKLSISTILYKQVTYWAPGGVSLDPSPSSIAYLQLHLLTYSYIQLNQTDRYIYDHLLFSNLHVPLPASRLPMAQAMARVTLRLRCIHTHISITQCVTYDSYASTLDHIYICHILQPLHQTLMPRHDIHTLFLYLKSQPI